MQLFVRADRTLSVQAEPSATVLSLKSQLRERHGVAEAEQRLVYAGRQLRDGDTLHAAGLRRDVTVHLVLRLRGGKGGFGALLRAGARSTVSQNTDACRDLSGRRMRHVNADKKLTEWAAEAKERELEKVALQHIKAESKAAERAARGAVDVDAVRQEHRSGMARVHETLGEAVAALPRGIKREVAPGAAAAQEPAKRARLYADSMSDSDSDDSDAEELPAAAAAGPADGGTATAPALEPAAVEATGAAAASAPAKSALRGPRSTGPAAARFGADASVAVAGAADRQGSVTSPKALSPPAREASVASNGSSASVATASAAASPGQVASSADVPAEPTAAAAVTEAAPVAEAAPPAAAAPAAAAAVDEAVADAAAELDWSKYADAKALEVLGMEGLKAQLQAAGLKAGGSLAERAARLFLLRDTSAAKLDRKHLAKPAKK